MARFRFCLIFTKCTLHVSKAFACNCEEDVAASSLLGILFERIACKSLIACSVSRLPEQNGSRSFSIASDLKGSWGRLQRNRLSFQNYKKKLEENPPQLCSLAGGYLFPLFFRAWGDLVVGVSKELPYPACSSSGGGCFPGPPRPACRSPAAQVSAQPDLASDQRKRTQWINRLARARQSVRPHI